MKEYMISADRILNAFFFWTLLAYLVGRWTGIRYGRKHPEDKP